MCAAVSAAGVADNARAGQAAGRAGRRRRSQAVLAFLRSQPTSSLVGTVDPALALHDATQVARLRAWPPAPAQLLRPLRRRPATGPGRGGAFRFFVSRVPLRACALDARSPKKPLARQPRLLHRIIPAGRDPAILVALRPLRPGSWPLSPSESAELGWGGPHSLRWEGGSALAASSPARCRARLRPATARASRARRACAAAALLLRPPVAASSSWRAGCGLARAHVCETPGALLPSARPGPRTRLRPFSPLRCAQARGRAAAEARCSAALS